MSLWKELADSAMPLVLFNSETPFFLSALKAESSSGSLCPVSSLLPDVEGGEGLLREDREGCACSGLFPWAHTWIKVSSMTYEMKPG